MIHVNEMPEPAMFNAEVRQKGLAFLRKEGIDLSLPPNTQLNPFWRACLDDLYKSYQGICAYLSVFFERTTGGGSVDHFIAKSKRANLAYEWNNYRLACTTMNSRKRDYDDVLDPFEVEDGWFRLELMSGRIYPSPELPERLMRDVDRTIKRLGLDDPIIREMRVRHYEDYRNGFYNEKFLEIRSPFVWREAKRQGLL